MFNSFKLQKNMALKEVGYFDVFPSVNDATFGGSWSNYPYYDSGIVFSLIPLWDFVKYYIYKLRKEVNFNVAFQIISVTKFL